MTGADEAESVWRDRTLVALHDLRTDPPTELAVVEEVALHFADGFAPADRDYAVRSTSPRWHARVHDALAALRSARLVRASDPLTLTAAGRRAAEAARAAIPADGPETPPPEATEPLLVSGVIAAPLRAPEARRQMGFSDEDDVPIPVMAEVNLQFAGGPRAAFARLDRLWERVSGGPPQHVADQYATGRLSMRQVQRLVSADAAPVAWPQRSIHRVWPDFPVQLQVDASCVTVKADAARRSFNAYGSGIVWAVVDTGIDGTHPHFQGHHTLDDPLVKELHRDLTGAESPLTDEAGHGTHVAGIIAGAVEPWLTGEPQPRFLHVTESKHNPANPAEPMNVPRTVADPAQLAGMAPRARLVSLRAVRSGGTPDDRVNRVIAALAYVREVNGQSTDGMRIHGVNLSVGYEFDPRWFACGRSPLCKEVDKLVRSGVAVVVAAGNTGYGAVDPEFAGPATFGLGMTINDPGNAERAITVGSTHRDAPHAYGVSYFSSKGPTGDGRAKPDLVAPGERITSCAAGAKLAAVLAGEIADDTAVYVQQTGTSMAAPHVSGALAALMSVRQEFIGYPDELKRIVVESATPLRRRPEFQGAGLLDLMRALQSI